jgi:hypothetical protein
VVVDQWHGLQPAVFALPSGNPRAEQAAEKVPFVIPSEARDLLFFSTSKKKQIPRANPTLRNDRM